VSSSDLILQPSAASTHRDGETRLAPAFRHGDPLTSARERLAGESRELVANEAVCGVAFVAGVP
jgi:hypothetical protein